VAQVDATGPCIEVSRPCSSNDNDCLLWSVPGQECCGAVLPLSLEIPKATTQPMLVSKESAENKSELHPALVVSDLEEPYVLGGLSGIREVVGKGKFLYPSRYILIYDLSKASFGSKTQCSSTEPASTSRKGPRTTRRPSETAPNGLHGSTGLISHWMTSATTTSLLVIP
jgi:hypothetical protein